MIRMSSSGISGNDTDFNSKLSSQYCVADTDEWDGNESICSSAEKQTNNMSIKQQIRLPMIPYCKRHSIEENQQFIS